ncbi:prolactin receptor b isoform X2 [Betta splendens]|uniref:Prolactin receptor b isoform X2 n=1 Tax=Betta splendens TaxID=158456 RepID=A0A6P7NKV6_BETSP|nr:prolactin receptor b isoform X2 [Betta splendens]
MEDCPPHTASSTRKTAENNSKSAAFMYFIHQMKHQDRSTLVQDPKFNETYECPDYNSAGKNSCFFDKAQTSIWVDYSLWVVASNALGNSTSDYLKTDLMEIVKPNSPENVTLVVEQRDNSQCLDVRWKPPHNIDTKSGWATIKYEVRIKEEDRNLWKEFTSGTQTNFVLYNIDPGVTFVAQVRCRLDHSTWSEWSNVTSIKVPNYFQKEKPFWIIISIVTLVSFITPMCLLITKRESVRQFLLPSVPGPKISGVDVKLLKFGQPGDITNALIISHNLPPLVPLEDEVEEYILVSDNVDEHLPDTCGSQIRKKSLIPTGFYLDLNIPVDNEADNVIKNSSVSEVTSSDMGAMQRHLCPGHADTNCQSSANFSGAAENVTQPLANSSYVDVQTHDIREVNYSRVDEVKGDTIILVEQDNAPGYMDIQRQDENVALDYSRVQEVQADDTVVLEKRRAAAASPGEKQKLGSRPCTELSSEYVMSVPAASV